MRCNIITNCIMISFQAARNILCSSCFNLIASVITSKTCLPTAICRYTMKYNAIQIMNSVCEKLGWRNGKVWRAWKTKDRENSISVRFSSALLATDFFQTFRKSNFPWSVRITKVMSPSSNQSASIVDISVPGGGSGVGGPASSGVSMEDISIPITTSTYPFTFAAGSNGINNMSW